MYTYTYFKRLTGDWVQRSDGLMIPVDPGSDDYQEYLAWVAEGNTPAQG